MGTATATAKKQTTSYKPQDVYQMVTDTIVQQLEAGVIPWEKPWSGKGQKALGLPFNYTTGKNYRGINILLLWCSATKNKYTTDQWASFKQWQEKKETIRKGEHGNIIIYYNTVEKEVDGETKKIPYLKASKVFNRCQLASYDAESDAEEPINPTPLVDRIDAIDAFLDNTKAIIEQHEGGACYDPVADKIFMPFLEKFKSTKTCTATEGFYSSLLHELTHWTGAKHRLNREGGNTFGDQGYAVEELVAEFGAAFLCAGFGMTTVEKGDHAGYINHWLKVLKENNRCLFTASSEASKAVDYVSKLNASL